MADVEKKEAPPGEVKESQGVEDREKQVSKMAAEMTGIPDGKAPSKQGSKEGIRSPQARQMEAAQYKPLIIEVKNNPCMCCPAKCGCTKECIIPIGCGNTFEDFVIIFSLLGTLWCGLLGFYTLLLKAQIDSTEHSTVLWIYFFSGIIFVIMVGGSVYTGQIERARSEKKAAEEAEEAKDSA